MRQIQFFLPATSANLGPGFDCLALALDFHNRFRFQEADAFSWQYHKAEGSFSEQDISGIEQQEQNLVVEVYKHICQKYSWPPRPFSLECEVAIPFESGLGSSATAVIAGIVAAYAFHDQVLDKRKILQDAYHFESHLDNLAATLYGGFTCAFMGEQPYCLKTPIDQDLKIFILYPQERVNTEESRKKLPKAVAFDDAVANLGRATTLVAAFIQKNYAVFYEAMLDKLHEDYRINPKMAYPELKKNLAAHGFYGWALSGSGPSVILFCKEHSSKIEQQIYAHFTERNISVKLRRCTVDNEGLRYNIPF